MRAARLSVRVTVTSKARDAQARLFNNDEVNDLQLDIDQLRVFPDFFELFARILLSALLSRDVMRGPIIHFVLPPALMHRSRNCPPPGWSQRWRNRSSR